MNNEQHKETGTIIVINDTIQRSETFTTRNFVVQIETNNPEYPKLVSFELLKDKCSLIDSFQLGQEITVHFNVGGRKWVNPQGEAKYFNQLECWRIEGANATSQQQYGNPPAAYQQPATPQIAAPAPNLQDTIEDSEIPF
jgi:hypothetical protein